MVIVCVSVRLLCLTPVSLCPTSVSLCVTPSASSISFLSSSPVPPVPVRQHLSRLPSMDPDSSTEEAREETQTGREKEGDGDRQTGSERMRERGDPVSNRPRE